MVDAVLASATVILALLLDVKFGEPSNPWHPVAWIGSLLAVGRRYLERGSPRALLLRGAGVTVTVAALAAMGAWLISAAVHLALLVGDSRASLVVETIGVVAEAMVLKCLISFRALADAAGAVAQELAQGQLEAGRRLLGYHLVSRPTALLDEGLVASATIESVAENLTDALIAPICFYLAFGLWGAAVYRAINTADAMFGYRAGTLEWFGKTAARLDDLLNLVPARLAGAALVVGSALAGGHPRAAWSTMWRHHHRTQSLNSGWTMAAMAGALSVTLEKPAAYRLGTGALPVPADIHRALLIFRASSVVAISVLLAASVATRILITPS